MPSFPVHIIIAQMLCGEIGVTSRPDFMLGTIAPDSVNLKGFASRAERYGAHIRSVDYAVWKKQLSQFYKQNLTRFEDCADYLKGYVFHCITDIAWDEAVQPKLFEFLQSGGELSREEITKLKWEELFRFNSLLVTRQDFLSAVGELENAQPRDIATVTAKQVSDYRDYVVSDYKDKISAEPPRFLNIDHAAQCAAHTLELYRQIIE